MVGGRGSLFPCRGTGGLAGPQHESRIFLRLPRAVSWSWSQALLVPLTLMVPAALEWALPPGGPHLTDVGREESKGCARCQAVTASLNWGGGILDSAGLEALVPPQVCFPPPPASPPLCSPPPTPAPKHPLLAVVHSPRVLFLCVQEEGRGCWPQGDGNATRRAVSSPSPPPRGLRGAREAIFPIGASI